MPDLVEYTLDDGTTVLFESAEADLVSTHGGRLSKGQGGPLAERLSGITKTAHEVITSIRSALEADELAVEMDVMVAGELNAWFFVRNQAEATIKVTVTWKKGGVKG